MAIRIGNIWDSTTDVLSGRAGMLMPVAAVAFLLPAALQAAIQAYGGTSPAAAGLGAVVSIVALVATLWGQLTVIGIASDPDVTREQAAGAARRRLGAALLVTLVVAAIFILAVLPIVGALLATGYDFRAAAAGAGSTGATPMAPAAALFCALYGLVLMVAGLWIGARLFVLSPVILHERRGIGAIARSVALTRGLTLKLIGVALLLVVVYAVAALAAKFIVFLVFRLLLGVAHLATATWLGDVAAAAVSAVFSTAVAVFAARLYAALTQPQGT